MAIHFPLTPLSPSSLPLSKENLTLMPPRRNDKIVFRHHIRIGRRRKPRAPALPKKVRRRAPHLHVRQVDAQTAIGAGAEGAEGRLGHLALLCAGEVAGWVEAWRKKGLVDLAPWGYWGYW